MKKYELLYIVSSDYTDQEVEGIMKIVAGILEKAKATIARNENLGRIRLAYPIKRARHGTYVLVHFTAEPQEIPGVERILNLTDEVLRQQIIIMPTGAENKKYELTAYVAPLSDEARKEKQTKERMQGPRKVSEEYFEQPVIAPPPPIVKAEPLAPPPPVVVSKPEETIVKEKKETEKPMTMEELDKRLDKILEDDLSNL